MKTLVINGSPRKNGDTAALINELSKYLDGGIKVVNTYYDNISACVDCRYCWRNDGCSVKDEMQDIYKLFGQVENVVIASPVYFSGLTGKLLDFASRLQRYYAYRCIQGHTDFKLKRKKGLLILTGGGDGSPEPAISTANTILRILNAELMGTVLSLKTDSIPAKEDQNALSKVRELAFLLNSL